MSFAPKTQPFSGKINTVTLGTGDNAVTLGGLNVLPFYTFDAPYFTFVERYSLREGRLIK